MKLIYISQGNIPSLWAHTFQQMKMAEALASHVRDFRLLTQVHWSKLLKSRFDYESFYGVTHPFRVVRMPVKSAPRTDVYEAVRFPDFDIKAVRYALRQKDAIVFTRSEPAAKLCADLGQPFLLETHLYSSHPKFPLINDIATSEYLRGVVTISERLTTDLLEANVPNEKIYVAPDAVNLECFEGLPDKNDLRKQLGLPVDCTMAMYCGHLYEHRGIEEIIASARVLKNIQFVIVGGREEDLEVRRDESSGLHNVSFTGFVPNAQVPMYLCASDILLMPYSDACETADWMSPMKLFEYMAARKPIVATDLPALRTHLSNEQNALLIAPNSAEALTGALRRLCGDAAFSEKLANSARILVSDMTWKSRAREILDRFEVMSQSPL